MILYANSIHRKAGVAILISDKIDFKITQVIRYKGGDFTMIKRYTTSRRHNNSQYVYTQSGCTKIFIETTEKTKGRN